MADGSDVGATVFVIIIALLLIFTPLGGMLIDLINGNYNPAPTEYWTANVSASPLNAGRVVPSGEKRVEFGETLTLEATALEGWTFREWRINETLLSVTPTVIVESQNPNETVFLVATFETFNNIFSVTPSLTVSRGYISSSSQLFSLINDSPVTITNVKLKLNDPYGIFSSLGVIIRMESWSGRVSVYYNSIVNRWSNNKIIFSKTWPPVYTIGSFSSASLFIADVKTNLNIEAGTYHLTFSVQFDILEGEFNNPPSLTVPWDVTVLG